MAPKVKQVEAKLPAWKPSVPSALTKKAQTPAQTHSESVTKKKAPAEHAASAKLPAGRWQTPLTRLQERLAELEQKLHKTEDENTAYRNGETREMVNRLGRRLLISQEETQQRPFPDSYYHHFGGLSQLEGTSESVLRSIEGRVCKIYNSMCSSLALFTSQPPVPLDTERALWDKYRSERRQKLQPGTDTGIWHRRRVAYPKQWRGLVTAAQATGNTNLPRYYPSSEAEGPFYDQHHHRPLPYVNHYSEPGINHYPEGMRQIGYDRYGRPVPMQRQPSAQSYYVRVSGEAAPGGARYADVGKTQYMRIAKRMRQQLKHLRKTSPGTDRYQEEQETATGIDAVTAGAEAMVQESGADRYVYNAKVAPVKNGDDGWSKTMADAAKSSGDSHYEKTSFNHPKLSKATERVSERVHKKLHARIQAKAKNMHSEEAAMRGAGGGKLDEWPKGEWHSFSGIDETGADYPTLHDKEEHGVQKPHEDWPAVKWHSHNAKDVTKPSMYKPSRATTHMLGAPEEEEEGAEVSEEEKAEWWYNYTKDYNPGSVGNPGLHEGQAYPAQYPKQLDDGSWEPDPGTGLGPKACIYMYAGPECGRGAIEGANFGLAAAVEDMPPIGSQQIKKIYSLHPSKVRGILWDDDPVNPLGETMYFVIPALHDYPRVPHNTKIDIREYVYTGHTVLMMGGVINIYLMNELFGWNLLPQYQPGPYLWNDRTAPGTPFEHVTRKVYEQGNTRMGMTGVAIGSIPQGGQSYFDNNGASVAMCIPLGRGRACYVDQEWIRPMTPYGCGVWAQIVQAALNGGRCNCLCEGPMIHPPKRSCLCQAKPLGLSLPSQARIRVEYLSK